ncbi:MAG: hypothetical protein ACP5SG_06985 [Dissulfurimicrobium sp.]|uniref:hypothetical protein n=1 Tax=Dissulfurimicrobium TaxID=1769732 RepID=UPI001EDB89A0|nr:hypothetical protein [Dissulfurimicrobium hydrothermale]UKL13917.1 hypothetical protein LGS26_01240 [Dissulfurimicrobium hydrothermale]
MQRIDKVNADLTKRLDDTNKRIDKINNDLIQRIDKVHNDLIMRNDKLNERIDQLALAVVKQEEHLKIAERVTELEKTVVEMKVRLAA